MTHEEKAKLIDEIEALRAEVYPFPYEGCRAVLAQADSTFDSLIPDLDLFSATIHGFCSSVRRIDGWDEERVVKAQNLTAVSFYEAYPEYERLTWYVHDADAADLAKHLAVYERMRVALQRLLANRLS